MSFTIYRRSNNDNLKQYEASPVLSQFVINRFIHGKIAIRATGVVVAQRYITAGHPVTIYGKSDTLLVSQSTTHFLSLLSISEPHFLRCLAQCCIEETGKVLPPQNWKYPYRIWRNYSVLTMTLARDIVLSRFFFPITGTLQIKRLTCTEYFGWTHVKFENVQVTVDSNSGLGCNLKHFHRWHAQWRLCSISWKTNYPMS